MIKLVALMKRNSAITPEAFKDYYEMRHAKLAERYLRGNADRYVRRYLQPVANPRFGAPAEPAFDVLTEMWFSDRETWLSTMGAFAAPDVAALVAEDERHLFDTGQCRVFLVEEHESDLSNDRAGILAS